MGLELCGLPPMGWASLSASKSGNVLSRGETFTRIYDVLPGKGGMSYETKREGKNDIPKFFSSFDY